MKPSPFSTDERVRAEVLFSQYFGRIVRRLRSSFPEADQELLYDAAVKALTTVVRKSVDPLKGSEYSLLLAIARRRVLEHLRKLARRHKLLPEKPDADVTNSVAATKSPPEVLIDHEQVLRDRELFIQFERELVYAQEDGVYLQAWLQNCEEREMIRRLGWDSLPHQEAATRLKRLAATMRKRFSRLRGRLERGEQ